MAEEETTAETVEETSNEKPAEVTEDWKARSRQHEREAKKERKAREDLEAKLAEVDNASKSEHEKALEKARKEAADATKAEVSGAYRSKILNAEIRAQAAGKFANPALASRLLDLDAADVVSDDGEADTKQIAKQIEDFLALGENAGLRASGASHRPTGSVDAGKGAGAATGDMNDFIRSGITKRS
jgi:hypothetical protein